MSLKNKARALFNRNSTEYNFKKAIEELTELSLELIQRVNKPHKNNDKEIIKELADVKIRLLYLEDLYGKEVIKERMIYKLKTIIKNVNNRRRSDKEVQSRPQS